jgi:hypothetical protein
MRPIASGLDLDVHVVCVAASGKPDHADVQAISP